MQITFKNLSRPKLDQKISAGLKKNPPGFFDLPKSDSREILRFAKSCKNKQILIIGIGGSSLPARTLIDFGKQTQREFYFLENVDPTEAQRIFRQIDFKKVLVLVVSKSGGTLETLANFFVVKKLLGQNWSKQTVFLTDPKKGFLYDLAQKEKVRTFAIPENVGGRFSIFTPVGLLPAALAGIDLQKLLQGAQKTDPKKALEFAQMQAQEFKRGKNIAVFCVYLNQLESLSKWFEQILAESIGKNSKVGITPAPAIGAIDQHSKLQLWTSGPNDKFYIFAGVQKFERDFKIPQPPAELSFLKNKSLGQILRAEFLATSQSLVEKKRPIALFDFEKIGPAELGEFLQFWMLEVYFLAQILQVNFADQPGVERGKILAKKRLARN